MLVQRVPDHCLSLGSELYVCGATDMAKLEKRQPIDQDHSDYDVGSGLAVNLHAARNESLGLQLYVRRKGWGRAQSFTAQFEDFETSGGQVLQATHADFFETWHHPVERAGHKWGADSKVLPWPGEYPDVLIPEFNGCGKTRARVRSGFKLPEQMNSNANIWIDLYIPPDQSPGIYETRLRLSTDQGIEIEIPFKLRVWPAVLPQRPTFDAVGELYRSYALEGVGKDRSTDSWREMAHCYQQMAHRHRMVFMERFDDTVDFDLESYLKYARPILNGELFGEQYGYHGTGLNTAVRVWRTPWEQDWNGTLDGPITQNKLALVQEQAEQWQQLVEQNDWKKTYFFAYLFDEIVGRADETSEHDNSLEYLKIAREAVKDVQSAIDKGAGEKSINLIWTSHANPASWHEDAELSLSNIVRLWAPNAGAADPGYLSERKSSSDKVWFYHDGHPSIGSQSINVSGIDMRTWGMATARYRLDGHFMWAINLGQDDHPFRWPTYMKEDDRYGNGVILYPGNQLDKIGYPAVAGPLPSMRLKAWRRGLQDAELAELARGNGYAEQVNELLRDLMPTMLADAVTAGFSEAQWRKEVQHWESARIRLLEWASK
ncbi:MAG: glycoside hydrolase domain-containing protein [Pseudomonadales bacterium]